MKTLLIAAAAMISLLAPQAQADPMKTRSVTVSMFGIGPAVDETAYKAMLGIIGAGFARGYIDQIINYGYGIEGGASFCLDLNPARYDNAFGNNIEAFVQQLQGIRPDPNTTSYTIDDSEVDCKIL